MQGYARTARWEAARLKSPTSKPNYFMRFYSLLLWQGFMIVGGLYFESSPMRLALPAFVLAGLLPTLVGYIAVFYNAPWINLKSRVFKTGAITLASAAVTLIGYWILLVSFMFLTELLMEKFSVLRESNIMT